MEMSQNNDHSKVVFEEERGWSAIKYYKDPTTPKMIEWVIKYSGGLIKDNRQANYVLLIFAVLIFILSLFLMFRGNDAPPPPYGGGSNPDYVE